MYEVVLFKDYPLRENCFDMVENNEIHQQMQNNKELTTETRIYVQFSTFAAHCNHNPFISLLFLYIYKYVFLAAALTAANLVLSLVPGKNEHNS